MTHITQSRWWAITVILAVWLAISVVGNWGTQP